jgi:hypothetical protein
MKIWPAAMLGGLLLLGASHARACDESCPPEGQFGPESGASCAFFGGALTFGPNAVTIIDIGGYTPCLEHDQIRVTGRLSLNGSIRVQRINDFRIIPGDAFVAFTFGSITGTATVVNATGLQGLTIGQTRTPTTLSLTTSALAGDTDLDADVDFADLLTFAGNYRSGSGVTWYEGDFDRNGSVDFNDLLALAGNYRTGTQPLVLPDDFAADWTRALAIVPEPSTAALIAGAAILVPMRRRRCTMAARCERS